MGRWVAFALLGAVAPLGFSAEAWAPDGWELVGPGSWMLGPGWCTLGPLVHRDDGRFGFVTAGHCLVAGGPVQVVRTGGMETCPQIPVLDCTTIGDVASWVDGPVGTDFGLILVRPEAEQYLRADIPMIGGPCAGWQDAEPLDIIEHYGHGGGLGTLGTMRAGVVERVSEGAIIWRGAASLGDSGSPVVDRDTLAVVGILTHIQVLNRTNLTAGAIAGTTASTLEQVYPEWTIVQAAACPPPKGGLLGGRTS